MVAYVAVYGTLRKGKGNWEHFLKDSKHVGVYTVHGFELYCNGFYPYAVPGDGEITIDLFEIDVETLRHLDHLEGYPAHYNRKKINVGNVEAWIYFTADPEVKNRCAKVPSGNWLDVVEKEYVSI